MICIYNTQHREQKKKKGGSRNQSKLKKKKKRDYKTKPISRIFGSTFKYGSTIGIFVSVIDNLAERNFVEGGKPINSSFDKGPVRFLQQEGKLYIPINYIICVYSYVNTIIFYERQID